MLIYRNNFIGTTVFSMEIPGPIGRVAELVTDPDGLKIIAMRLEGPTVNKGLDFLDTRSIREYSELGIIIDSVDELVGSDDIAKLRKVLDLHFDLIDLKVETKKHSKLGKIIDFTFSMEDFKVKQLIVKRPLMKSFVDPELIIPRQEIIEITDYKVIVKDEEQTIRARAENEDFVPNFVNPFRKTEPAGSPAHTETPADTDIE